MNGYDLSRNWFDFAFENPELISPCHSAIYFFAIEHCNRLGWKEKFGLPSQMAMDAIGIKKNHTYTKYFNDLVNWGFIKVVQRSKNQYSSNIISLKCALLKNGQALGKAMAKHAAKHGQSMRRGTGHIDKPLTLEPKNQRTKSARTREKPPSIEDRIEVFKKEVCEYCQSNLIENRIANEFISYWTEPNQKNTKFRAEMEKTFAIPNRIGTWKKIDNERSAGKGVKKSRGSQLLDKMRRDELNNQNLLS